jgi:hypothetical protein
MSPSPTQKLASSLTERDPISLNLRFDHSIRAYSARALKCRSVKSEDFVERSSPFEVKKELEICFDLVHRLGRGIVYLGSARIPPNHSHYLQAQELSREVSKTLNTPQELSLDIDFSELCILSGSNSVGLYYMVWCWTRAYGCCD